MSQPPESQDLKSWEEAFHYPIPTVRRVEQDLLRDIESSKEKLRALVGLVELLLTHSMLANMLTCRRTRYRELVGTAETIVSMDHEIQQVESSLIDVGRRCNPNLVEKKHSHFHQIKGDGLDRGTYSIRSPPCTYIADVWT